MACSREKMSSYQLEQEPEKAMLLLLSLLRHLNLQIVECTDSGGRVIDYQFEPEA